MARFYVPQDFIFKDIIHIRGREAHHVRDVMRLKAGDEVIVFDGNGGEYVGVIDEIGRDDIIAKISKTIKRQTDIFRLALAQAIPKASKMDLIIEKATELGVERIIPIITSRTIVQANKQRSELKLGRWNRLAVEASKQCGRVTVPRIEGIEKFEDSLSYIKDYELAIIPCLHEGVERPKDILKNKAIKSAILYVGPEGDFTEDEVNVAKLKGAMPVSLGKEILRSETAAIAALSILSYEFKW